MLFMRLPCRITHRRTCPSAACHWSTPSRSPAGTRRGSSEGGRPIRFRAFAACAIADVSGVHEPRVLGRPLRLILMRMGYCVVRFMIPFLQRGLPFLESLPVFGGRYFFASSAADIEAGDSVHKVEPWMELDGSA